MRLLWKRFQSSGKSQHLWTRNVRCPGVCNTTVMFAKRISDATKSCYVVSFLEEKHLLKIKIKKRETWSSLSFYFPPKLLEVSLTSLFWVLAHLNDSCQVNYTTGHSTFFHDWNLLEENCSLKGWIFLMSCMVLMSMKISNLMMKLLVSNCFFFLFWI